MLEVKAQPVSGSARSDPRAGMSIAEAAWPAPSPAPPPSQTGAQAANTDQQAIADAEVVVLAVQYPTVDAILAESGQALDGKVLIDTTNRVNPADPASVLDGTSAAEQIQSRVPGARVVKAFNTAFASRQADPVIDGVPLDGYLAGDNDQAKQTVSELVGSIGLRPIGFRRSTLGPWSWPA